MISITLEKAAQDMKFHPSFPALLPVPFFSLPNEVIEYQGHHGKKICIVCTVLKE